VLSMQVTGNVGIAEANGAAKAWYEEVNTSHLVLRMPRKTGQLGQTRGLMVLLPATARTAWGGKAAQRR
jgi:hypothetical protein